MRSATIFAVVTVAVVGVLLTSAFALMFPAVSPGSGGSQSSGPGRTTSSQEAGDQTFIATFVSTMVRCCSTTTATSSSTQTSTSASTSSATTSAQTGGGGSYSYAANPQVKILSVSAAVSGGSGGQQTVSFAVEAQNIGSGNITAQSGGGSGLNSTILSGGSYVASVPSLRCEIAVAMVPVAPGGTWTSTTPGCWSGYYYQLDQHGTIEVQLILSWSGETPGSVVIDAEFTL